MGYLYRLLDSKDPNASLRHAAYGLGVASGVFWLSWWCIRGPRDANFVAAFGLFLAAVVTAKAMPTKEAQP